MNDQMTVAEAMQAGWEKANKLGIRHTTGVMVFGTSKGEVTSMCALGFTYYGVFGELPNPHPDHSAENYRKLEYKFPQLEIGWALGLTLEHNIYRMNDTDKLDMPTIIANTKELEASLLK